MNKPLPISRPPQQGVMIIEAMIAILLFSIGVLAIVGLQAVMIKHTTDSKFRADASYIAQQCIGEMWITPGSATCPGASANAELLPNGSLVIAPAGTQLTVTILWLQPGEPDGTAFHNFTTIASIVGN